MQGSAGTRAHSCREDDAGPKPRTAPSSARRSTTPNSESSTRGPAAEPANATTTPHDCAASPTTRAHLRGAQARPAHRRRELRTEGKGARTMTTVEFVTLLGSRCAHHAHHHTPRPTHRRGRRRPQSIPETSGAGPAGVPGIDQPLPSGDTALGRAPVQGRGCSRCRLTMPGGACCRSHRSYVVTVPETSDALAVKAASAIWSPVTRTAIDFPVSGVPRGCLHDANERLGPVH